MIRTIRLGGRVARHTTGRTRVPGSLAQKLIATAAVYEPRGYHSPLPIVWDEAHGCTVIDVDGNRYLDFTSGVAVMNIGHSHPAQVAAVIAQAGRLLHSYNYVNVPQVNLARRLVELTPSNMTKAYILTTGAEAVEAAVRAARRYTGRHELVAFSGAFHGRTYLALSLTGKSKHKKGVGPLMSGVLRAPFPYCFRCPSVDDPSRCRVHSTASLDAVIETDSASGVCAVVVEAYQAAGGMVFPSAAYMQDLRRWCDRNDALLILDEIQSGFGRTGEMFCFEHYGIAPDLVCLGKGLSAGGHISAVVGRGDVLDSLDEGTLTTTDGGNPLSCAIALAAIDVLIQENLCANSKRLGADMLTTLSTLPAVFPIIGDVRGLGLAVGIEVVSDRASLTPAPEQARQIVEHCYQHGLLVNPPTGIYSNVVGLTPPLVLTDIEARAGLDILTGAIRAVSDGM